MSPINLSVLTMPLWISIKNTGRAIEEKSKPVFFDRGIPDLLGYCHLIKCDVPDNLRRDIEMYRYNKIVFIAPPWEEIYAHDEERKQGWEEAVMTYQKIVPAYVDAGYEAIELPKSTVEERVEFVLTYIAK
jgi:predicted ATPase